MENYAIVIGASDYKFENKLPGCQNDIDYVKQILELSGKYQDIFYSLDESSNKVNTRLSSFIKSIQNKTIGEVFFYFTGHGSRSDDFLYLFSDYSESSHNSTSLTNSDLDKMLRSLNPDLLVKIIDACNSSTAYIKSEDKTEDIMKKSSGHFKAAYFMYSSRSDQTSKANENISYFTRSFLASLDKPTGTEILFREIMSHIADDNFLKSKQTPQFVSQADNTEIFLKINPSIKSYFDDGSKLKKSEDQSTTLISGNQASLDSFDVKLAQLIKEREAVTCSEIEAKKSIDHYLSVLRNYSFPDLFTSIYKVSVLGLEDYKNVTGFSKIGQWLHHSEEEYFARVNYTSEKYRKRINKSPGLLGALNPVHIEYQDAYRDVPSGISLTVNEHVKGLSIELAPTGEVLPWYEIYTVYLFSKTELVVFIKYETLKNITWESRKASSTNAWRFQVLPLKDKSKISTVVNEMLDDVLIGIKKEIAEIVGLNTSESSAEAVVESTESISNKSD